MFVFMQRVNTPDGQGNFISFVGSQALVAMNIQASTMSDEDIMKRKTILNTYEPRDLKQALQEVRASSVFQINKTYPSATVSPIRNTGF